MTSFHAICISPLIRAMYNISAIIEKARASDLDAPTLLTSRLHPTMAPFTAQIKFFTSTVTSFPSMINPSLPLSPLSELEDNPTFDILLSRIATAISYLESIAPEDLNGRENAHVQLRLDRRAWAGDVVYIDYEAVDYVQMHVHPNFWFHITTAYDLLRAGGLELGKPDFINAAGLKKWDYRKE